MIYAWTRFWVERSELQNVVMNSGFLDDFSSDNLETLNDIDKSSKASTIVLLGDAGMGKSIALQQYLGQNTNIKKIDLFSVWDKGVFNAKVSRISDGDTVYFDSFDECFNTFPHIQDILSDWIRKNERMHVCIVCRSSDWPHSFEAQLGSETSYYHLLPLRELDIKLCAEQCFKSSEFIDEINRLNLQSFASRPIVLKMLIQEFEKTKKLPTDQWEIYEKGSLYLCEEHSSRRKERKNIGDYSAKERLVAAARIAATMKICNFRMVSQDFAPIGKGILSISQLVGGEELLEQGVVSKVEFTDKLIQETLEYSALFKCVDGVYSFSTELYSEFLAAWYLDKNNVSVGDIQKMMILEVNNKKNILPSLKHTFLFLSNKNKTIFKKIMKIDPLLFIYTDIVVSSVSSDN